MNSLEHSATPLPVYNHILNIILSVLYAYIFKTLNNTESCLTYIGLDYLWIAPCG